MTRFVGLVAFECAGFLMRKCSDRVSEFVSGADCRPHRSSIKASQWDRSQSQSIGRFVSGMASPTTASSSTASTSSQFAYSRVCVTSKPTTGVSAAAFVGQHRGKAGHPFSSVKRKVMKE